MIGRIYLSRMIGPHFEGDCRRPDLHDVVGTLPAGSSWTAVDDPGRGLAAVLLRAPRRVHERLYREGFVYLSEPWGNRREQRRQGRQEATAEWTETVSAAWRKPVRAATEGGIVSEIVHDHLAAQTGRTRALPHRVPWGAEAY